MLLASLAGSTSAVHAQSFANTQQRWGTWIIGTVQLPGNPAHKWGGFGEVQARGNGLFRQYFYNELKLGVSYDIDPKFTVMAAGGR